MRRFSIWLTAAVLNAGWASLGAADIINVEVSDGFFEDNGTISAVVDGADAHHLIVEKTYEKNGEMSIEVFVNSDGDYLISETIANDTGTTWTDFHWELAEEFGDVSFVNVNDIDPFTTLTITPGFFKEASAAGGLLADAGTFSPSLLVHVDNPIGGLFFISQFPTIPEPATIGLMAVMGLVVRGRRCA